jgi:tripartite-type tricarboxylate transporter receptor subunit TctC
LSKAFNTSMVQTFIVDNRTGAGGLIGAQLAVGSPPDGHTILVSIPKYAQVSRRGGNSVKQPRFLWP